MRIDLIKIDLVGVVLVVIDLVVQIISPTATTAMAPIQPRRTNNSQGVNSNGPIALEKQQRRLAIGF